MRPESYWVNQVGIITSIDEMKVRYPITVRFDNPNYNETITHNFGVNEIQPINEREGFYD